MCTLPRDACDAVQHRLQTVHQPPRTAQLMNNSNSSHHCKRSDSVKCQTSHTASKWVKSDKGDAPMMHWESSHYGHLQQSLSMIVFLSKSNVNIINSSTGLSLKAASCDVSGKNVCPRNLLQCENKAEQAPPNFLCSKIITRCVSIHKTTNIPGDTTLLFWSRKT